jgi:hypothetical protein
LLIAAGQAACAHLGMRDADIEQFDGVIGNRLRLFAIEHASWRHVPASPW